MYVYSSSSRNKARKSCGLQQVQNMSSFHHPIETKIPPMTCTLCFGLTVWHGIDGP